MTKKADRPLPGGGKVWTGLPVLRLPDAKGMPSSFDTSVRLDQGFAAYAGDDWVEIQIDGHTSFDEEARHGDLHFMIANGCLAGIRVHCLLPADIQHFSARFI